VRCLLLSLALLLPAACGRGPAATQPEISEPAPVADTAVVEQERDEVAEEPPPPSYDRVIGDLGAVRRELSDQYDSATGDEERAEVIGRARDVVFAVVVDEIIPRWYGTPWDYHGTTEVPGEGFIACGYFVSTVLRDAGFRVERAALAQQPSEWIVKTFSAEDDIWRFRGRAGSAVAEQVRAHGDGLHIAGLDIHVGFVVVRGERVDFCDASFLDEAVVTCEPVHRSPGFVSSYRVVGKLLSDGMMVDWLTQQPIRTHLGP